MAVLTAQEVTLAGVAEVAVAAAAAGDSFPNDGKTVLKVINAHATLSRTVTVNSLAKNNFDKDDDPAVTVPAVSHRHIGPFNPYRFNDSNGRVGVTYSDSAADLTVVVVKLGKLVPG